MGRVTPESAELRVMREGEVWKIKSRRRKDEEDRWRADEFNQDEGAPWKSSLALNSKEIRSGFRQGEEGRGQHLETPTWRVSAPKRVYVTREDVADHKCGMTWGCK